MVNVGGSLSCFVTHLIVVLADYGNPGCSYVCSLLRCYGTGLSVNLELLAQLLPKPFVDT